VGTLLKIINRPLHEARFGTSLCDSGVLCFKNSFIPIIRQLEKPSLDVAPTTLATFSSCYLKLLPTTFTYELLAAELTCQISTQCSKKQPLCFLVVTSSSEKGILRNV